MNDGKQILWITKKREDTRNYVYDPTTFWLPRDIGMLNTELEVHVETNNEEKL